MNNEKIAKKMLMCLEKDKFRKYERLFLKHRNNEELWDILLQNEIFTVHYLKWQPPENMDKLSVAIQKKIIEVKPNLIRLASDELRNDRNYMEDLQHRLDANVISDEYKINVYDYLGSELANDKEYLISIQDEAPLAFLKAIKRSQFDDEIVKKFFDKHPGYVSDLPDNLKYNYEYVASLIERIPAEHIAMYCGEMEYQYLQNEQVKNAIIRHAGENEYIRVLLISLANYPEQLKNISPQELRKLILHEPDIFIEWLSTPDKLKGFLSTRQHRQNMNLIQNINKTSKLLFSQINTPQKLSNALFELSNSVGEGLTYETILNQVNTYWDKILPWIKQVDEWHLAYDDKLNHDEDYRAFYNIYNILVGIENNKLDEMFKIFINSELRISRYASGIKNINVTEDNLAFLQFACTCNLFNSDARTIEMYNKLFLKISKWNNNPYMTLEVIDGISKNQNIYNLLINTNIDALDQELLINLFGYMSSKMNYVYKISSLEELRDYQKLINSYIDKLDAKNLQDTKHKVLLKHFQINEFMAKNFIHSYFSSDDKTALYQNMPEVKYLKYILESIINTSDIKVVENIDKDLTAQNVNATFRDVYQILSNIKRTYGKEINSSLLQVNGNSEILDISNMDFNLLVHVIGAYGDIPTGDVYDSWNTKEKTSSISICTSFISDNNMGIAPTNDHSVVLGFNNLHDDFLELMSCNDLYSRGFSAKRSSRFLNPEELKNNTRHGHNEVVVRRRKGEFTEEKVEPSYIICFDSINEESKVASQKFGVPILYIDREKVAERHHNEIIAMLEQFKTTLDPHLISKIICEQENNKAGLRLVRPDLVEKYFSTEFRQKNIDELYSSITNGLNTNNQNAIVSMNEFVRAIEEEADKFKITKETPYRKNTYDVSYTQFLEVFKANPAFKQDAPKLEELTPEEIYEKFLQCRNILEQSESTELQYLNSNNLGMTEESTSSMKVS